MPYAPVNHIQMYYEEAGSGSPLLLLHGATGAIDFHASGWGGLMPGFAERYRAIHVEHRGHGRTGNPAGRLSYGQIASDVHHSFGWMDGGAGYPACQRRGC
jgi:3-oxoadipate enol-lactonase